MPKRSLPNRKLPNRKLIDQLDQAVTQLLAARVVTVQSGDPELLPLLHIAAELRQLPREDFKARLKSDLERKSSMATVTEPVAAVRTVASPRDLQEPGRKPLSFTRKRLEPEKRPSASRTEWESAMPRS